MYISDVHIHVVPILNTFGLTLHVRGFSLLKGVNFLTSIFLSNQLICYFFSSESSLPSILGFRRANYTTALEK